MVRAKSTEEAKSKPEASNKDKFTKEKLNKQQQRALALAEGARQKKEPNADEDVSKIVNGVKKLKVEERTRNSVGSIPIYNG